jgi:alanyl-tRNA synthetase
MLSGNEIRQQFLDFFKKHGHTIVPSSPVVPQDDPTLLFTNAGMNQFKDVFLGTGTRPYKRVADTQKCIRAGGKHNDLDDVGRDTYHHTFFEMLGNWSFGDYFKKEAIQWAWGLLTEVWKLDKSRLHATVFEGSKDEGVPRDDEAYELWKTVTDIDHTHIHFGNKKDNFWEMGETGPCGPCTEIHIDRTPDKSGGQMVNKGTADVIEIWNLVFIQFNRNADRSLTPLPAKHVDTGMGFERITAVIQGKASNYDTDVFAPVFAAIQKVTGAPPYTGTLNESKVLAWASTGGWARINDEGLKDTAYRVVADHIRTLTFALTDGARIGNVGRDYVLRRILRRAERYGRQYLGAVKPFLCELVPTVVEVMGEAFPELKKNPGRVATAIRQDEEAFIRTLDRGIKLFQEAAKDARDNNSNVIRGEDAFNLHTTYGFFIDLTEQMALEAGMTVDRERFDEMMRKFIEQDPGQKKQAITAVQGQLPPTDDSLKYQGLHAKAKIIGSVKDNQVSTAGAFKTGDEVAVLLDRTNFYAEQGGQVGDTGTIKSATGTFEVENTQRLGDSVLHVGRVLDGHVEVGQAVDLQVSGDRADTMRNHTATHLLNWALRRVLGEHIEQKGSLVDAEKTRFDFAHDTPLSADEVKEVERLVNEKIYADLPVTPVILPLAEAKKIPGVRAVFGEKYPDPVRVLMVGAGKPDEVTEETSVEFCGGTHLHHTGEAGFFKITSQEAVGKGVRRVIAVTGREAVKTVQQMSSLLEDLGGRFSCRPSELPSRIDALEKEIKTLQQQLKKGAATDLQGAGDKLYADAVERNGSRLIIGEVPAAPVEQLRNQVDRLRQKAGSAVVVVGWKEDGDKVGLIVSATDDLVKKGIHAGKLVGQIAKVVGGGGGGKPNMAQAGGKDPAKLGEALALAKKLVAEQLG